MSSFVERILYRRMKKLKTAQAGNGKPVSGYRLAKEFFKMKVETLHRIKDGLLMLIGAVSAGFGLESFLLPNGFIDGGVTGISLLVSELAKAIVTPEVLLPLLIIVLNIPFIVLGWAQVGRSIALRGIVAIAALALAITFIDYPVITSDKLLVAVFGGMFLGMGIGLAVRGGAVLDGTEVLAIYVSKRTSASIGDTILVFNVVIFSAAAWLLSMESALYSILAYMSASKTVDFILEGIEEYTGVTIVSSHSDEIRTMIIEVLGRGVTVYSGIRGYGKRGHVAREQMEIIYTVLTRLEVAKFSSELNKIDPDAFVVMSSIKDTKGGMIKKRAHKH